MQILEDIKEAVKAVEVKINETLDSIDKGKIKKAKEHLRGFKDAVGEIVKDLR